MRPPTLRPAADLAQCKPHGTRIRYMGGCRCVPCRAANSRYATERDAACRRGESNGIVSAAKARRHLENLSRTGIGRRAVAAATDIASSIIAGISSGKRTNIRRQTELKILAVDMQAISDHSLVPAKKTWQQINELLDEGFTKAELARRLGAKTPALQLGKARILAATAAKIDRFYRQIMY